MMMTQRRYHKKSRHGCSQCKQNRTKCDEVRPKCGRCLRIGSDCSLASQMSGLIFMPANHASNHHQDDDGTGKEALSESSLPLIGKKDDNNNNSPRNENNLKSIPAISSIPNHDINNNNIYQNNTPNYWLNESSASSSPNNDTPNSAITNISDIERERLRLITHYTLHTAPTITEFSVLDGDQSIWRDWVLELAFKNDFLLYGLLSLSALHLALLCCNDPSSDDSAPSRRKEYTILAIQHYDLGVASFRSQYFSSSNLAATAAAAVDHDAVFAFSFVVAFYSFGIQQRSLSSGLFPNATENPIAKIHQVLALVRSSSHIAKQDFEALTRGRWSKTIVPLPDDPSQQQHSLPEEMENMLLKLMQYTSKTISTTAQQEMYMSTIQHLRTNLVIAVMYKRTQVRVSFFVVASPAEYWKMVCIGEPLALAILANYAVILHWLRGSIWIEGWGKETVDAVRLALPSEWQECIAWAVREVEGI